MTVESAHKKPDRFYLYNRRFFWTYWTRYARYNNPHFNNEEWRCWEEWAVFFGFKPKTGKWFDYEDHYYDGHTLQQLTFCGISIGKMYSYDASPVEGQQ